MVDTGGASSAYATYGTFGIQAMGFSSTETVNIYFNYFNTVPVNGVYTTINDGQSFYTTTQVFVTINGANVASGGSVYVSHNSSGTTTVSFCSLIYNNGTSNVSASAMVTF